MFEMRDGFGSRRAVAVSEAYGWFARQWALLLALGSFVRITACASTNPRPAFEDVRHRVEGQAGHRPEWPRDAEQAEATQAKRCVSWCRRLSTSTPPSRSRC